MNRLGGVAAAVVMMAAGCAQVAPVREVVSVREMPPGYAVVVATFAYVPGESEFARAQIFDDALYAARRLSAVGYQAFTATVDSNTVKVGARASTYALAKALKREIDKKGRIDLGDGRALPTPEMEIVNLAEIKLISQAAVQ